MTMAILIMAAGASQRMRGRDKLLEDIDGMPLLFRTVESATKASDRVIVTVPSGPDGQARRDALPHTDSVEIAEVEGAAEGLAASIRCGVERAKDCNALMVLPADMPDLTSGNLITVRDHWRATPTAIVRATSSDGTPGHPVVIPKSFFGRLARLQGDRGARDVLAAASFAVSTIALPGDRATTDLDTPEDWDAWRAKHYHTNEGSQR